MTLMGDSPELSAVRDGRPGADQPRSSTPDRARWERPALAAIVLAALVVYAWDLGDRPLARTYSGVVRSMSESWTGFVFGAVDPAASITVDKLPGGFWPQALAVRIFGFHPWSVLLPQLLMAIGLVLLLHRVVRRHAGPVAALVAALVAATTPVVAVLAHAQQPDTMLTLLLVAAAGATLRAAETGRLRWLLWAGVWVGLAVQVKMLVAWGVLPALAVTYLVAAPGPVRRRIREVTLAGALTLAVSALWTVAARLTPAGHRPYIDGTADNDPLELVVGYNGISRFLASGGSHNVGGHTFESGLLPTVLGAMAPQALWLLPIALLGLVTGLLPARAGRPADGSAPVGRTRLARAGLLLWGGWLLTFVAVFSLARINHEAYVMVLVPPVAALTGTALAAFRQVHRDGGWRSWLMPVAVAGTVVWAVSLTRRVPYFLSWLAVAVGVVGAVAVALLVVARATGRAGRLSWLTGLVAVLLAPAAWTVAAADPIYSGDGTSPAAGPAGMSWRYLDLPAEVREQLLALGREYGSPKYRDTLYGPPRLSAGDRAILDYVRSRAGDHAYLLAVPMSTRVSDFVTLTGASVLPMGGFSGETPFPDRDRFRRLIAEHRLRYVLAPQVDPPGPATVTAANLAWVRQRCVPVDPGEYGAPQPAAPESLGPLGVPPEVLYDCGSADVGG